MSSPTGPTPPPPKPQQYSSPEPAMIAPTGPGLTEPQRLMNVFFAPGKTFEDLKRNDSWWVPWLVTAVFTLIFAVIAMQKIDMPRFIQQQTDRSPMAQKQLERLTPEQRAQNTTIRIAVTKVAFYAAPVFSLIIGLICAAVLMAIFNFFLGAEVPFSRAMGVVFYSGLTGILATILLTISLLVTADTSTIDFAGNPMPTNPGFFLDPDGNKVLYGLASSLDIFRIWYVILLGLGFAKVSSNRKPSVNTGITTAFVAYGILVLIGIGFKVMFS